MSTTLTRLDNFREKAESFLKSNKFPSNSDEAFRFTSLRKYFTEDLKPYSGKAEKTAIKDGFFTHAEGSKIVFINGVFSAEQSVILDDNFEINPKNEAQELVGKAITEPNYFTELNGANFTELFVLKIKQSVSLSINIFHVITTSEYVFPRLLVVTEKNVEATINYIVSENGSDSEKTGKKQLNSVIEIFLEENAQVNFNLIEKENTNLVLMNTIEAVCKRDARFYLASFIKKSLFVRNNVHARLIGKNAYASLSGFYHTNANELADNHILIDHQVPDCESHQFYKGLLDGESTGVFNGRIMVHKDAQRTNAYQSSKAILLSTGATVHSMPQLEIFADDVKCSHGAAIGQLSKDELFYFKARGIDEATAKSILNFAYAVEVIGKISDNKLQAYLLAELQADNKLDLL